MSDHHAQRAKLTVLLDQHIVRQLEAACDDDVDAVGSYLEHVVLQRTRAWQRSVHELESAGWVQEEVRACHEGLRGVLFFDPFEDGHELAIALRTVGLRWLSRRIACRPMVARALWCVLLELRARNCACARAVGLMRPRLTWWTRFWSRLLRARKRRNGR
jgi:hypothetical protein